MGHLIYGCGRGTAKDLLLLGHLGNTEMVSAVVCLRTVSFTTYG